MTASEAEAAISSWLAQPVAGIVEPGERHWDILRQLIRAGQAKGPLVMDAVLAAIAIEHGLRSARRIEIFPASRMSNGRTRSPKMQLVERGAAPGT